MLMKMNQRLCKVHNQKGFTLVELMVVVVILGVLVAIAVPVYNSTTTRAATATCQANQRMIEGAVTQYLMENPTETMADVDDINDLAPFFQGGVPTCPSGGTYSVTNGVAACTTHAHY